MTKLARKSRWRRCLNGIAESVVVFLLVCVFCGYLLFVSAVSAIGIFYILDKSGILMRRQVPLEYNLFAAVVVWVLIIIIASVLFLEKMTD